MTIFSPTQRATRFSTTNNQYPPSFRYQLFNNCNNTLCYTYNNKTMYHPHSASGRIGTIASTYLAIRKRI